MAVSANNHAGLMDDIYRYQRRFYDATRKYYLLGRDRLITQMAPAKDAHILEIACGTGRNLDLIDRRYPGRHLYGLDISQQMLETAGNKLGGRAILKQGDACHFDPDAMFGRPGFDHIVMSYSLSMIPDWQAALTESLRHLSPGGMLHLVDFGDQEELPRIFKATLTKWLKQFHVSPREDLKMVLDDMTEQHHIQIQHKHLFRNYAQVAHIKLLA